MDFIKRFFGSRDKNKEYDNTFRYDNGMDRAPESPPLNDDIVRGFNIFSDPLHMHQYFEHQMNEVLKMFGFHGFDNGIFSESYKIPIIEEGMQTEEHTGNLRDHYLKRGYESPKQFDKKDEDVDGKINLRDLDSLFGRKATEVPGAGVFFGQIMNMKTIKHPDGSIETHNSVRDNEGNEEVTVCHKINDKEYCMIKKKDKHGREEITEKFVNLDENERDKLFKSKDIPVIEDKPQEDLFDRFFK